MEHDRDKDTTVAAILAREPFRRIELSVGLDAVLEKWEEEAASWEASYGEEFDSEKPHQRAFAERCRSYATILRRCAADVRAAR